MSDEGDQPEEQLPLEGAGERLARARADSDMTVEQVAAETRIPLRHLQTMEAGAFSELPGKTYAIGFARSYAKVVGLDEQEIAAQVREELSDGSDAQEHRSVTFEPGDPARVPSRGLAWFSAFAALLLIAGAVAFFRNYFIVGSGPGSIVPPDQGEEQAVAITSDGASSLESAPEPVNPAGAVVFTSREDNLWVRFYEANGDRLMEKVMSQGESYTVPADASNPQIRTGQPENLVIRIGGKAIGTLSNRGEIVGDVSVKAEDLIARMAQLEADASEEEQSAE